jgi:hypothetical protein
MIAENQTFTGKRIQLDGSSFTNCRFNECRLVFNGLVGFELVGSHFQDCRYDFEGPARETIQFMRSIYHTGGDSAALIERIFEDIRRPPTRPPQAS